MNDSSLPMVLVTHTLPEGWLDLLSGHCRLIIGPPDANNLSHELSLNLGQADDSLFVDHPGR
jgi:hypothetical protein